MKVNDTLWGVVLLALGAALLVHVQTFPGMPGQKVGPALFPGLIAAGLTVCGAILAVRGWRTRRGAGSAGAWVARPDWWGMSRPVLGLATLVAVNALYLLAGNRLGFIPTGVIYLGALMRVLGVPWRRAVPLAVLLTLLIHLCFHKLLRVPLPWGVLQPVAW